MNSGNKKYLDRIPGGKPARTTKKSRIPGLWRKGDHDIWRLASEVVSELRGLHDRAGQHHCLAVALTLYNRALFLGKRVEAEVFLRWLLRQFGESSSSLNAA